MYAFAGDETTLLVHRWIVLRFADGTSYGAFTDLNGYLAMRTPPVAEDATVRLELPESVPLER
jgi:hypothetical protein